jgi:hypothetical protein
MVMQEAQVEHLALVLYFLHPEEELVLEDLQTLVLLAQQVEEEEEELLLLVHLEEGEMLIVQELQQSALMDLLV